jgi:hypothetical protein
VIRYDEYLLAAALTLARQHRPVWSRDRLKLRCRCGADFPCASRGRALRRVDWPAHREVGQVLREHRADDDRYCIRCRTEAGRLVTYPCPPVEAAVRTFATELGERLLDGLR